MLLDVCVINTREVLFEGKAHRVLLPGEQGAFEVLPYHKPLISLLVSGIIVVDKQDIPARRGVVKVEANRVTAIIE